MIKTKIEQSKDGLYTPYIMINGEWTTLKKEYRSKHPAVFKTYNGAKRRLLKNKYKVS